MQTTSPTQQRSATVTPRRVALGVLLVGVLLIGIWIGGWGGADGPTRTLPLSTDAPAPAVEPAVTGAPPAPAPDTEATPGPAADARGAVEGFLTAEATGNLEVAFTHLAAEERAVLRTPAAYVAAHADLLGQVTGFAVLDVVQDPASPDRATVVADVGFVPSLDTVAGLVAARSTATFPVVRDGDGWGVSLAGAAFEPVLPGDDRAAQDARSAVEAAVACEPPASAYGGILVGQPSLLADLCGADGPVDVAAVTPLDDPLVVQPFLSAYGPEVGAWARVADVRDPVPLRLVLAPRGDAWTLIGVVPPPSSPPT